MSDKRIILITGGNTGIGYETVKALYSSENPYTILMGSRSLEKANTALAKLHSEVTSSKSDVVPVQIDIEDDTSIENAFKQVDSKFGKIDVLVNNAGGTHDNLMQQTPGAPGIRQAWDRSYSLNVTSTQVFTTRFMPLLLASTSSPRLIFLTSGVSSLTNCSAGLVSKTLKTPPPKGWPKPHEMSQIAYRSSKTALNMMMLDWDRILEADGVKVFAISPGFLATGLVGNPEVMKKFGAGDASLGGEIVRDVVEGKRDADAGKVVSREGIQPW